MLITETKEVPKTWLPHPIFRHCNDGSYRVIDIKEILGFWVNYYKLFVKTQRPQFLRAFNSLSEGACFPVDTVRAWVTVIPKEGRDPKLCQSYYPISCFNI